MAEKEFLEKRTWAVVGVTPDPERFSSRIYRKLQSKKYDVYAVNPRYSGALPFGEEGENNRFFPDLASLPEVPDVVDFVVNPSIGKGVLEQCVELGITRVWLQPGTVSEELLQLARDNGIEVVQNCVLAVSFPDFPGD
ncbi:MAG TPA: CoA-binding protein [Thermotogota bacterium]|nr:CoA-binding protein [Thermotogota bacterium]HRW93976.1 CoA-binding protein [Thermotogota bacterium]